MYLKYYLKYVYFKILPINANEWATPDFTPQQQRFTALSPVVISYQAEGRRLSWPRVVGYIPMSFAHPKTVTDHSDRSANRIRRRVTNFVMRKLPLRQSITTVTLVTVKTSENSFEFLEFLFLKIKHEYRFDVNVQL